MDKFKIDFDELNQVVDPCKIPLKGNENKLIRVAFDLFRFKDGNPEELWQVQSNDDGQEYIVRAYELPEEQDDKKVTSSWAVELDKKGENLTISYHNIPLLKLSTKNYDVLMPEDVQSFQHYIYKNLATDNDFVNKLVKNLSLEKQNILKEAGFSAITNNIDPKLITLEQCLEKKSKI